MATETKGILTEAQVLELKGLVDQNILDMYPDLIQMLFESESLSFDEKKYWMELFPLMTEEHIKKLREILENERRELATLQNDYTAGKNAFVNATPVDWTAEAEATKKRKEEEQTQETKESTEEENLLSQL